MSSNVNPIVVATDFSTRSDRALRRAALLAKQSGASLVLAHVIDGDQPKSLIDAEVRGSRSIAHESALTPQRIDGIEAEASVTVGDVFAGILKAADDAGAGLLILGKPRWRVRDAFIGTTAERAVAHSPRPVLLAAGVPSAPYSRMLFALETDGPSRLAIQRAQALEYFREIPITALHVFEPAAEGMMKRAMIEPDEVEQYVRSEHDRLSGEFSDFLAEAGLGDEHRLLVPINGTPARTILETAQEQNFPLVVMGSSQKKGLKRMILGSVAEQVLGEAECDVLVVPNTT